MAGLSDLPEEILLHILSFLDPREITILQLVSRGFYNLARDDAFWRARCLEESSFLDVLHRRRRLAKQIHQALHGGAATTINGVGSSTDDSDDDGDSPRRTAESRERERVRIMANWDPCFPSERVSWYGEYIQRHGPVVVNWMQYAYDEDRASPENFIEARGVALYYPDGELGETVLAVSPLDDGGVCLWDVGDLIEVDLQRLSVVDCESFPCLGIHLHDYRSRKPLRNDESDRVDGFERMGAKAFYERSIRHIFDDEPLPPYAPLSQPGPLSILHLQQPGREADLSDDIYVAGRFSNILHYDRRKFPSIRGSIHSGARLCSMTSLPYPFSTLDSELRRKGELSVEQVEASKSAVGGRTLVACGEYNTKGSLELYGLTSSDSAHTSTPGGLQNCTFKNRQTCSQSKLLSVVNHGTRIAFSDGSGYIKWFERDGFTEVRRCRIGHSERSQGPSIFASMPGSDDMARKLLPTRPAAKAGNGTGGGQATNVDDLLFWTGEKLGLVTFSARPGFTAEDFEQQAEMPDAETLAAQNEYSEMMRRALERQADDVRFVRDLGLPSF
ncbi:a76bd887-74f0-444b-a294-fb16acb1297a [Thermothielavioides terrestris]|uniref:A76bd887-74f0-444b-a294-fb16acb1297a n=1 Tax=Thermothielavioides terrestris TaxID=2587410 RepID=A0A446B610_9PEZI|nr:a76bd887-74f0-444b-a294-fb16acb1297a [Thermothielavioides terrestris]